MPAPLSNAGCGTQPFRTRRSEQWARTEIDLAPAGRHVGHIHQKSDVSIGRCLVISGVNLWWMLKINEHFRPPVGAVFNRTA